MGYVRDTEYERELIERFQSRAPRKIFDAHFHLSPGEIDKPDCEVIGEFVRRTNNVTGEDTVSGGLLMGNPNRFITKEQFDAERLFSCQLTENTDGFVTGLLVRPQDGPEDTEKWLEKYPRVVALKPYKNYAPCHSLESYEVDILDFAPEWMWALAEKWNLSVIIHLSHYTHMLNDSRNGEQIRYICQKYPKAKMVLAHCAMAHHPDKFKSGLHYLDGLDNIWMDCSGISDPLSIIYAIRYMGAKKIMYGSDGWNFGQSLGRIVPSGGNFYAVHPEYTPDFQLPPDYKLMVLPNVVEGLYALYAGGDVLDLTPEDYDDIFWNNAEKLYLSAIRK